MKPELIQIMGEIESLSNNISELAHQEEWEQVSELDESRTQMLRQFFDASGAIEEQDAVDIRHFIDSLMNSIEQVSRLAQASRDNIHKELKALKHGQTALSAYSESINASE